MTKRQSYWLAYQAEWRQLSPLWVLNNDPIPPSEELDSLGQLYRSHVRYYRTGDCAGKPTGQMGKWTNGQRIPENP